MEGPNCTGAPNVICLACLGVLQVNCGCDEYVTNYCLCEDPMPYSPGNTDTEDML